MIVHPSDLVRVCPQPLARRGVQEMVATWRDLLSGLVERGTSAGPDTPLL
jgi:hypothetical protein